MSDAHASPDHGASGHDSHDGEALGPIDVAMWSVGLLGVAIGLLVCLCTAFATGML